MIVYRQTHAGFGAPFMLKETEMKCRAGLGAARMDAVMPGWFKGIDKQRLEMRSSLNCIAGQAFKGSYYVYGANVLEDVAPESFLGRQRAAELGFALREDEQSLAEALVLKAAWIEQINQRLAAA